MLYIISKSYNPIVGKIIDWLNFYGVDFLRVENFIDEFNKIAFTCNLSDLKTDATDFFLLNKVSIPVNNEKTSLVSSHLVFEYLFGFFSIINKENKIGNILQIDNIPKVIVLKDAKNLNIPIPETLITNCKDELLSFYFKNKKIITKSSHDLFSVKIDNIAYRSYTKELSLEDINGYSNKFGLSLFQNKVEKKCDIKTFYFEGNFYSQAIFSQNSKQTELDFRVYNFEFPSRVNTFKLPIELEQKVRLLLKNYNLQFAILDFVLDKEENLFFLEINVDGIFEGISEDCNYYIEKIIADYIYEKKRKAE